MKKALRKMKIRENSEEVFSKGKEYNTHYVKKDDRSRYNNWNNSIQAKECVCSKSKPGYWRN